MEFKLPKIEEEILKFWQDKDVFKKSLKKTEGKKRFVFYEGPPFANGLPGIHHLLARAFKDVILRYKTMQGFYVERKAGWDTHGLPTEMAAEKSLKINSKKEIEENIEKFIAECQKNVFTYKKEWESFTQRIGYWLDLENAYITCGNDYMESLWWILKQVWNKGFLYQDYKVVPYCPRCGTSLSSHEVAQGYKTTEENSVYVKFKVNEHKSVVKEGDYLLAWTTTPWTLPANVALAVNEKVNYVRIKINDEFYVLAEERLGVIKDKYEIKSHFNGKNLIGLEYEPPFNFSKPDKPAFRVVSGDFVSTEDGTGLVHIAPAFGEDDMRVGKENDLPVILNVDEEGKFKEEVSPWSGKFVKEADPLVVEDLKKRDLLYKEELYSHEYPFCWRCGSPLIYYAKESWFIKTTAIKKDLIDNNGKINWIPPYFKEGRFGEWLREVKDWNLSRERYWGTPLPIWVCEKCKKTVCIGSIEELKEKAKIKEIGNLHRPHIDEIVFDCECGGKARRVKEVIDCWFDSGSMPFAQWHYPFENKELIDKKEFFPADFICEGIDQTRGWFYTLLVVSTLLGLGNPYRNVISIGIVLDEKGQKMSKSKGNVVKPSEIVDKYGADAARFYFYTVNAVAESKNFSFNDIQTLYRKFFDILFNVHNFFNTYADRKFAEEEFKSKNILDKWIASVLERLNSEVEKRIDDYDVVGAARLFEGFVDDLSNWYVRRSRKRFQKPENDKEKEEASSTLRYVLLKFCRIAAPFTPFIAESIYRDLGGKEESVHLSQYPCSDKKLIDDDLEEKMRKAREVVSSGLAERMKLGIKVKQPLSALMVKSRTDFGGEISELIKEEVNVKKIIFDEKIKNEVELDATMTVELEREGKEREFVRNINSLRKTMKLVPADKIVIGSTSEIVSPSDVSYEIKSLERMQKEGYAIKEIEADGKKEHLGIKKI
ncbi:MAG: isoleucine--tRNA ligase [Candidatus Pacebacteria bacterium]|nr:isoleucine--tRNA ligase [Candidatus Paceibacterota bacterium]